jgi:hypothetical protein
MIQLEYQPDRGGKADRYKDVSYYCNEAIPLNKLHVINRVKREGDGYNIKQIHIFHTKLALSKDEFQQLLTILWSSSDVEIIQKGQLG